MVKITHLFVFERFFLQIFEPLFLPKVILNVFLDFKTFSISLPNVWYQDKLSNAAKVDEHIEQENLFVHKTHSFILFKRLLEEKVQVTQQ
jgi:hypothetical protein